MWGAHSDACCLLMPPWQFVEGMQKIADEEYGQSKVIAVCVAEVRGLG